MKESVGIILLSIILSGCATGVSTYEYTHLADGSTAVKIKSANEIGSMQMGINRETGTLEVVVGDLTKKSDTVEVMGIARDMVRDVATAANPLPGG